MSSSALVLVGSYHYSVVVLSVLIAVAASYTALDLAGRVTAARGWSRLTWLIGGAIALGIGTWSMHYTGMLAFHLPVPMQYHWPTTLLSLLAAIGASILALFVVSRSEMGLPQAFIASIFIGGGIAGLHYLGMASMRLPATTHYSPALVTLSIVFAIGFSWLSLWLTFLFRDEASGQRLRKAASALLMGAAIWIMHYTGMAAATFTRSAISPNFSQALSVSYLGIVGITIVACMVLGVAVVTSMVDKLQEQRALLNELFEQGPEPVALLNVDNRIVCVNREFTRIFGFGLDESVGRHTCELIVPEESQVEAKERMVSVSHGLRVDAEGVRARKDGTRLHVAIIYAPVSVSGGQIARYVIYRDITGRKQTEEQLNTSLQRLRALTARLEGIREEERKRVAREIHDELGQALTAIKLDLVSLVLELPPEQKQERRVQSILRLVDQTIQSVRRISTELRPGVLDDLGLIAAVEWAAEEFQARTRTACRLDLPQEDIAIDPECATAIFRIFQETVTNIVRHAHATQVDVRLAMENSDVVLEVLDNGRGLDEAQVSAGTSLGLLGMRERALLLGGELTIRGTAGKGTIVRVRLPRTHIREPNGGK